MEIERKLILNREAYLNSIRISKRDYHNKSRNTRSKFNLLVVGAGGIGCELIKILVTSGFKKLTIVDMDNVEKSNLNRQFVYNQECISKPKAHMIKQRILELRKGDKELQLTTFNENIKNKNIFNYSFFSKFDFIINALDNVDARLYVSDIAFLLQKPLINGGTEGLLGFVGVYYSLFKNSPCYNCTAKNKTQTIPVCSIKSKPHKIEHCIAWGKNLFEQIFCQINNEDLDLLEDNKHERSIFNLLNILLKKEPQKLIETLESKEELKITLIDIEELKKENKCNNENKKESILEVSKSCIDYYLEYLKTYHSILNKKDFSFLELLKITIGSYFLLLSKLIAISIDDFRNRLEEFLSNEENIMKDYKLDSFNKDNKEEVDFVFAISNLRAYNFNIDQESRFKIHEVAGKIIPAIVTTNAIIAGIMVDEIVKFVNEKENSKCEEDLIDKINKSKSTRNSNLNKQRKIVSVFSINDEKNNNCSSCSKRHPVLLVKSDSKTQLKEIISEIIKKIQDKLGLENKNDFSCLSIYIGKNLIFDGEDIEESDSNEDINIAQLLSNLKIPSFVNELEGKDLKIELDCNLFYIEFDKIDRIDEEQHSENNADEVGNNKNIQIVFIDFYYNKENHNSLNDVEEFNNNNNNNNSKTLEIKDFVNLENDDGIVNLDGNVSHKSDENVKTNLNLDEHINPLNSLELKEDIYVNGKINGNRNHTIKDNKDNSYNEEVIHTNEGENLIKENLLARKRDNN